MKIEFLIMAMMMFSILVLNQSRGLAQLATPTPSSTSYRRSFLQTDHPVTIPVGVSSFDPSSKIRITGVWVARRQR